MNEDDPSELEDSIDPAPSDDASSVADLKRKRLRKKKEFHDSEEFWRSALSTEIGRKELWKILESGHCFETRFACGPNGFPQPEHTWYALGEQSIVRRLYDTWQILDHAGVFLMRCENDPLFPKPNKK
jgi:hypothetical protein